MKPSVCIELTGKGFLTGLFLLIAVLGVLYLVWLLAGPGYAIAGGLALFLLVRGLLALLTPS